MIFGFGPGGASSLMVKLAIERLVQWKGDEGCAPPNRLSVKKKAPMKLETVER
jgi:hypothetical protein